MSLRILVSGMACGDPWQAGATWAVAQYVLGLRRLGHDVWLVEPVDGELDASYADEVIRYFSLEDRVAFVHHETAAGACGAGYEQVSAVPFDLLVNVAGMLHDERLVADIPVRVYLDLDPAFTQLWQSVEGIDMRLDGHTHYVTVGQTVGTRACSIPSCGVDWIPTLPPVVLDRWASSQSRHLGGSYTTVGNWRSYGSIDHAGVRFGQRAHSMRTFLPLPVRTGRRLEVALAIADGDGDDRASLIENGWALADPLAAAGTPSRYRAFVQSSRAEIGIAKSGYVIARCGWFSDRSACYLASGLPVVAQDTGARMLPTGCGLLVFSTLDDAVAAIEEVERDYAGHARAARELAEEYLDSDRVLGGLLEAVGLA
jgi:hypothetical protein